MKKIIAIAAAAAIMSGMLQSVYADTGFDIVSASCNDSGEIVVTFNGTPAQNNEAVYFVDGDGIKTYSTPTIEDNSLKIAFPNELLGKNTKLVVSGDTVSQDNVQIEQAYVYPVVADNITESFNSDCNWVYLDTNCLSQNTETINNSYTVTTAGQLDKHSVGEAVTSGQLIEKANGIIAEVLALTTTENLAEKTAQLNEVISELSIFGMNENDIPTYQDYLDKCDLLQRFDVADVSPSKVDAQYLTVSFTRPVDASKINDCIYLALDDRTKLDAEISVNTSKANEINIKLPVKFADRYANLVITPDFQSADGIKIHTGRCVRMKFTKAYTDCINEEEFTKDFVEYSMASSKTDFKDTTVRNTNYTFTEEGLKSGGTWFARDKDWATDNMVIEILYKSSHAQPHGFSMVTRVDGLYTSNWQWYAEKGYKVNWWPGSGWINDLSFKPDSTVRHIFNYGYDQAVASGGGKAGSFKLKTNQWYTIRMVTTTLESGDVKVDVYATEAYKDNPTTYTLSYTDTTPNRDAGLFMIRNDDATNNAIDYIVCTSAPEIVGNYSIDDIKVLANEMSASLDATTVDSSKREEVQYLSNTMAFLQNMGVDISELAGYENYTQLGAIFPSMTSCKVTDDISNYYFDFEMTHPVKPEFVDKSSFTVLNGSSVVEEYDVSLLEDGKTLRVTLYNDRTYSGKYKITASKNIENTNGLNIGKDFVYEYTEKAPVSLIAPTVSESNDKINVVFNIKGDDTTVEKSYVAFTLLLQYETKEDGKTYTKTINKNIESGTLTSAGESVNISSEFDKPEGEYEIYTTVLNDLTNIKQIYKSFTVPSVLPTE